MTPGFKVYINKIEANQQSNPFREYQNENVTTMTKFVKKEFETELSGDVIKNASCYRLFKLSRDILFSEYLIFRFFSTGNSRVSLILQFVIKTSSKWSLKFILKMDDGSKDLLLPSQYNRKTGRES